MILKRGVDLPALFNNGTMPFQLPVDFSVPIRLLFFIENRL